MLSPLNREGFFNSISLTNHADIKFNIWIDNCYRLHYRYAAIKKADKSEAVPAFWDDHLHTNKSTAMLPYARGRKEDVSDTHFIFVVTSWRYGMFRLNPFVRVGLCLSAISCAWPVLAVDDDGETMVVTASSVEQNLKDAPASISVIT